MAASFKHCRRGPSSVVSMTTHDPDRIRALPAFEGHFEASEGEVLG